MIPRGWLNKNYLSVLKQFVWLRSHWSISTTTPNDRWIFYHILRSTINTKIFSCLQKRPWTERTFKSFLPQPPCCTSIHGLMNVHGFCAFGGGGSIERFPVKDFAIKSWWSPPQFRVAMFTCQCVWPQSNHQISPQHHWQVSYCICTLQTLHAL